MSATKVTIPLMEVAAFAGTLLTAATAAQARTALGTDNASNLTSGTVDDARLPDTITSSVTGNAGTATKLQTARTLSLNGDATGTSSPFDGSANNSLTIVLGNSGVSAGAYGSNINIPTITVDAKGRVISASVNAVRTASTTQTGVVQLNTSTGSTSTTEAATPSAVKTAYDIAVAAIPLAQKSVANGVAPLDATGKVPAAMIPVEGAAELIIYADYASLPVTGLDYRTWNDKRIYVWLTDAYYEVSPVQDNAPSATKLETGRTISVSGDATGTSPTFDGTGNVTIPVAVVNDSHNHSSATITDATSANTPSTIVKRDTAGNFSANVITANSFNGNAVTATKFATARQINGVSFDGTANITVYDNTKQAANSNLTVLSGITPATDKFIYFTDATTPAMGTITPYARTILDDVDAVSARTTLGAQAADATLTAMAGVDTNVDKIIYFTGVDAASSCVLTSFARTLLDDTTATAARTTLGAQASHSRLSNLAAVVNVSGYRLLTATSNYGVAAYTITYDWFGLFSQTPINALESIGVLTLSNYKASIGIGVVGEQVLFADTIEEVQAMLGLEPPTTLFEDIGVPGEFGFGVGITASPPTGYTETEGCRFPHSSQYGNYVNTYGDISVWVPKFYARIGHVDNPTYSTHGLQSVDIVPASTYANRAAAAVDGYFLPRAFINASTEKSGIMIDKYFASASGDGIAHSKALVLPVQADPSYSEGYGYTLINAAFEDTMDYAFPIAKTRGSGYFPCNTFVHSMLGLIAQAHAQASVNDYACKWWDAAGTNTFIKGQETQGLYTNDPDDTSLTWANDSYYTHLTLLGTCNHPAKVSHNGQLNGIMDVCGSYNNVAIGSNMMEAARLTASNISNTNPVEVTTTVAHGLVTGDVVKVYVGSSFGLTNQGWHVTVTSTTTFTIDYDASGNGAPSAGSVYTYKHWILKESVDVTMFTEGTSDATSFLNTANLSTYFNYYTHPFYGDNTEDVYVGVSGEQIYSSDSSGADFEMCAAMWPMSDSTNITQLDIEPMYTDAIISTRNSSSYRLEIPLTGAGYNGYSDEGWSMFSMYLSMYSDTWYPYAVRCCTYA